MNAYPIAWIVLRIVYAWLYLYPVIALIKNWQETVDTASLLFKNKPKEFTIVSVVIMIIGALSILLGIYGRIGGVLLLFFNLGGAYIHYQLANRAKDFGIEANTSLVKLAVLGNVSSAQKNLVLAAVAFFFMIQGTGPWSITPL